jgi:hypothetical protein
MEIVEKTKGRGRTTQRKATTPITKAVSKKLEEDVHQSSENALVDILTNPSFTIKRTTLELNNTLETTFSNNGVELERDGNKVTLSSEDIKKLLNAMKVMKDFYSYDLNGTA